MRPTIAKQGVEREEKCVVCGKIFIAKGHAQYCSRECKKTAQKARERAKRDVRGGWFDGSVRYANQEYYKGCIGCVDFESSVQCCGYILHYEKRRPCKMRLGCGCELYSKKPRKTEKPAPPGRPLKFNEGIYRKLYAEGLNDVEAAKRMGVTKLTIQRNRKRLGLPSNYRRKEVGI